MMYTAGTPGTTPNSFYSPARATASGNQDESFVHSEPVNSTTYTGQPREPDSGIPETDRQAFAEQPSQSRPEMFYAPPRTVSSSNITPLTAALWGIMAAGVWLGCSSGIQVMPSMEQSCLSAALILLFIGWCGFSAAGQAGTLAALLAEGIGAGCVVAGIWAEKGDLLTVQNGILLMPGLLLPVTVWAAGNSIRNSGRIWNCLKNGKKAPDLRRFLLRMLAAEVVCGAVFAAGWLLRRG